MPTLFPQALTGDNLSCMVVLMGGGDVLASTLMSYLSILGGNIKVTRGPCMASGIVPNLFPIRNPCP